MCRSNGSERRRGRDAGFTLIEALVALAVVAATLAAIGTLTAGTVRSTASIERHLALVETARAIEAALPDRRELRVGELSGNIAGHRWQIDVLPFAADGADARQPTPWAPQRVVIKVRSATGQMLQVETVRLRRNAQK